MSLYVGYKRAGTVGALAGLAGIIAPLRALMLVVAAFGSLVYR
jgi:chromate transport protein ChrA